MEERSMDMQNNPQHENMLRPYLDGLEEDASVSSSLNACYDETFGGRHFISDYKLHSNNQCIEDCSKCSGFTVQSCTDSVEDQSQHHQHHQGFTDLAASHILYAAAPPLNIPLNLTLSKRFTESFKLHRRTRSTNYYNNALLQYASAFGQRKLIVTPSGKWIYNAIETDENVRNLKEGSVVIHLADLHSKEMKLSDLTRSPSSISHIPLARLREGYNLGKRRSASKISDLTFISSSSSKSTCSYQSELSEYDLVSKGLLRCTWKDGLPYFVFSLTEDHGEVYIANPWKVSSINDKALDYIYIFYSRENFRKGSRLNYIYRVVGKMKVSSCLSFSSNKSKLVETEFVLYDAGEYKKDMMSSSSHSSRSKVLPRKMLNIFRQTDMDSQNSSRYDDTNLEFGKLLKESCLDDFSQLAETGPPGFFKNHFMPNLELSAIIIKDYQDTNTKEKAAGGWGLKFLETRDDVRREQPHELPHCSELDSVEDKPARSMNVLIPAGSHGGPSTKVGGPSSLTDRWRTGGRCDCGGWDIGCPLIILHNQSTCGTASPMESSQECQKLVNLFVQGAKQDEPAALRITALDEGMYGVSFQSKFSALQAFSVGVATVHSWAPALKPEL